MSVTNIFLSADGLAHFQPRQLKKEEKQVRKVEESYICMFDVFEQDPGVHAHQDCEHIKIFIQSECPSRPCSKFKGKYNQHSQSLRQSEFQ